MARRTRKKKRPRLPRLGDLLAGLDPGAIRRALSAAAWLAAAVGVVFAWTAGVPRLQAEVTARHGAEPVELRFVDPPAWLNGDLEAHLVLTGTQSLGPDPLVRADLVAARASLLETGWFTDIRQVRRVRADRVEVEADFVQPFAVIRDAAGDHLVSPQGRLLPRSVPVGHATRFKVVHGPRFRRPARPGLPWEGADVTAALRLLRLIDGQPWRDQVVGVDVAPFRASQQLHLITDRGHRINWGRAPGEESGGEVTTERKLYYLQYPYENFGHIDGGYDGDLDITDPRGVFGR